MDTEKEGGLEFKVDSVGFKKGAPQFVAMELRKLGLNRLVRSGLPREYGIKL